MKTIEERIKDLETNGVPGLRDFMAVSALSILSRDKQSLDPTDVARYCYSIADAMLIERNKPHGVA